MCVEKLGKKYQNPALMQDPHFPLVCILNLCFLNNTNGTSKLSNTKQNECITWLFNDKIIFYFVYVFNDKYHNFGLYYSLSARFPWHFDSQSVFY